MSEIVLYFLKSAGLLSLFLGLYFFFLRKETFFSENRFFLLGGILVSLILPFLVIIKYVEIPVIANTTNELFFITETTIAPEKASISWWPIIGYTYLLGFFVCSFKFIIELFSLLKLLKTTKISKKCNQFIYVETSTAFTPFSFFNYIVYNPDLYTHTELEAILKHEQAHSRQLHSLDVFIAKLYCIFMWFNPLAWVYKKFISQNLEFLADRAAIQQSISKKEYQLTLLKVSGNSYCPALTNNFYNSLIKKRIVMLQKTQSTQFNRWKQALILPLLVAFVLMFNTQVIAKETSSPVSTTEFISTEKAIGDLVVVITKNTTLEELKAYKKLFSSQKIQFSYSNVDFNSKGEIQRISLSLTAKKLQTATGEFKTDEDNAIGEIQLGKRNDELFIQSNTFAATNKDAYAYTVKSEFIDDKTQNKKFIVKKIGKGDAKINTWIQKDSITTINIREGDGEDIIIINGKRVSPETIIEEEIEIKKGDKNLFIYSNNANNKKEEEVEIEVIKEKDNKIVFRNSSNEQPLIVIDGKVSNSETMNQLDADKIKSVSVLKGESAISKYGSKAKDGAIEIITKKN
ncbi:M56 family metallopeptidase [Kordia zhangzhouensis]|uniref:M56 family metallopeptidase n=1 Tax=Kordia zhangzhouensis TaxID=1620405 RepID=UPI00069A6BD8|nr:M56 family metallopeptidase [Kordia zhangzhouensis]